VFVEDSFHSVGSEKGAVQNAADVALVKVSVLGQSSSNPKLHAFNLECHNARIKPITLSSIDKKKHL
jgi:hypothetical protein